MFSPLSLYIHLRTRYLPHVLLASYKIVLFMMFIFFPLGEISVPDGLNQGMSMAMVRRLP